MIVAIPVVTGDPDSPISSSFGKSRFFVLFNTVDKAREVVENPYAESLGDSGIQSAQMMIQRNVDAMIIDGIGKNAFRIVSAADIKLYKGTGRNAGEAVGLFLGGNLAPVNAPNNGVRKRRRRRLGRRD